MNVVLVILASTLTLTAPENGTKFDPITPCTHEFLNNHEKRSNPRPPEPPLSEEEQKAKAEWEAKQRQKCIDDGREGGKIEKWNRRWNYFVRNDWTQDLYNRCNEETKTLRPFTWTADFKPKYFVVEFSETADFKKSFTEKTTKKGIYPHYLKFNQNYFWRVKATDKDGQEVVSETRSFSTLDGFPRILGNPQCNWRDIGGGLNADGKRVRQGMIIRTPGPINWGYPLRNEYEPNCLPTPEMLKDFYINTLGIKSQCDLRGPGEAAEAEKKWYVPQLDKAIGIKVTFFSVDPYHLTGYSWPTYVKAIKYFADKDNYPILFNCAAGSDRTGSLGVLLDAIIGRTDEQIYDDYELPTLNPWVPRLRYNRGASEIFHMFGPKTSKWGKPTIRENAICYMLESGVTQEDIDAIRKIMIEE